MSVITQIVYLPAVFLKELALLDINAWCWLIVIFAIPCGRMLSTGHAAAKAPFVGYRSRLEPTWLLRLRFMRTSQSILQNGYNQFQNSMFRIRRIGSDVLLLPSERIEELRGLTRDLETSVEPFMNDFAGELTSGPAFLHSDLQNRVLQQKLIPNLGVLAPIMKAELDLAISEEIPSCEAWVKVDIVPMLASIVARISARIFIGPHESRNKTWLTTTAQYTENIFKTGMLLRVVPVRVRPLIAPFLPTYRELRRNRATANRIICEIIEARKTIEVEMGGGYDKPTDILQWMMDMAVGDEKHPENIAQRMLILSLSSIHTTALTMSQALYDLIAQPEFVPTIEREVVDALRVDGGWHKATLNRFRKMDSLLKESQRFNPIFLVTFNRILYSQVVFADGTVLHPGTRIAVPSYNMLHDPKNVPGPTPPSEFDPFRYSRLREDPEHPENAQKYLFAMVDLQNMAFGYGKHACPGRAYSSDEMKMILAHILLKYEWTFPTGQERPKNFTIDTDMYPDRSARVMIRQRQLLDETVRKLL